MRCRIWFAVTTILVGLSSAAVDPQQNGGASSVDNHDEGIPRTTNARHKRGVPRPNWDVKFKSGSLKLKAGQWLKSAFISEEAPRATSSNASLDRSTESQERLSPIVDIPLNRVLLIYFNPKAERDSNRMRQMPRSGCGYAKFSIPLDNATQPDAFVVWSESPSVVWRTVEHLNQRYPIRFVWKDDDTKQEFLFTVNHCEYAVFLANLRKYMGEKWKDVRQEFPQGYADTEISWIHRQTRQR